MIKLTPWILGMFLLSQKTFASGTAVHMMIAKKAIETVQTPQLKQLLKNHTDEVLSGMIFPDTGYYMKDRSVGEFAHWGGFLNAYAFHLKKSCPDFNSTSCQKLLSHYLGCISHSVSDILFDRYFVTAVAQNHFGGDMRKAQAYTDRDMDFVAIVDHRFFIRPKWFLPVQFILETYDIANKPLQEKSLTSAHRIHRLLFTGEKAVAYLVAFFARRKAPWAAQNYYSAPGGINPTSIEVAQIWEQIWQIWEQTQDSPQIPFFSHKGGWPQIDFQISPRSYP